MGVRRNLLEELKTRLETITTGGGFNTDAGSLVFLGEIPALGPDDADVALAIGVGEDVADDYPLGLSVGDSITVGLPVTVYGLARADLDEPWVAVENVLEDIASAVETDAAWPANVHEITRTSIQPMPREEGSTVVGLSVEYRFLLTLAWGSV